MLIKNLDNKTRANAWRDNMIGNNSVVIEWKENFRLSQPNSSLFWQYFVSRCRGNKQLANHLNHEMFLDLSLCVNSQESKYLFNVNAFESEYSVPN